MTPQQSRLLDRIRAFDFDAASLALSFAGRLARDNGWTTVFALRVMEEYRKFVFLAMASGHVAVPSDQVDQVWHQHLQYTRSWAEFQNRVLEQTLHHDPSRGGPEERLRFEEGYAHTLASYRRFFGEPPEDAWPPPARRFGTDLAYRRVNVSTHAVIPRVRLLRLRIAVAGVLLAGLAAWLSLRF
jgi:hypothetical protein